MGNTWCHDLDDILAAGVGKGITELTTEPGWLTRSRGSGGLDELNGILNHHTVSGPGSDPVNDIAYICYGNPYAPSPVSQLYSSRSGRIHICAAGAANHGGRGGQYKPVPGEKFVDVDRANQELIGMECSNWGNGTDIWPWEQIMAIITVNALINLAEGWLPERNFAHKEYCGPGTTQEGRKIDPLGPWEDHPQMFWPSNSSWGPGQGNIALFRTLVARKMTELRKDQPVNSTFQFLDDGGSVDPRIVDSRFHVGVPAKLTADQTRTINVPGGAGKTGVEVTITVTEPEAPGFITVWGSGAKPNKSVVNHMTGDTVANSTNVKLAADGTFKLYSKSATHIIVDLGGYFVPVS